jgi:hypothetical protein
MPVQEFLSCTFIIMNDLKLYMVLLGCRPMGRSTEQHDIFFGIGSRLKDLVPAIKEFWPDGGKIHIDAWREVTHVDGFTINVYAEKDKLIQSEKELFFINLGGYKKNEFDEFHYKMLTIGTSMADAVKDAKQTTFYKHTGFKGAASHIDEKYGIDVDDVIKVNEILAQHYKQQYNIHIIPTGTETADEFHLGYLPLEKI